MADSCTRSLKTLSLGTVKQCMDRTIDIDGVPIIGIDIAAGKAYIQSCYWLREVKEAITNVYGIKYFVIVDCIPQVTTTND